MAIKLKVWGDFACFTRPEMKVERVSYDVMTPSAARGILEAIHWKPAIKWEIQKIHIINPIKFENIRRNELENKISEAKIKKAMNGDDSLFCQVITEERQQRASMVLKDVCYIIEARFEMTEEATQEDTPEKHYNIALRRMKLGQCFHRPYFGCREFPVNFELIEEGVEIPESYYKGQTLDLGRILWDMDFATDKNKPPALFFRAEMVDGIINIPKESEVKK